MAEPMQPKDEPIGYTADQVKALLDERIAEVQRNVEIAREAQPPHVTIQDYFERIEALRDRYEDKIAALRDRYEDKLAVEREKGTKLALDAAEKLEQERLARSSDQVECERRINVLTRELSQTAIDKAEEAANQRFGEVSRQLDAMRGEIQALTGRMDQAIGQ
jgi:hypothetical protein